MSPRDLARELDRLGKLAPGTRAAANARAKRKLLNAGLKRVTYRMPLESLDQISTLQRRLGLEHASHVVARAIASLASTQDGAVDGAHHNAVESGLG